MPKWALGALFLRFNNHSSFVVNLVFIHSLEKHWLVLKRPHASLFKFQLQKQTNMTPDAEMMNAHAARLQ